MTSMSDKIRDITAPYDNPFQGTDLKLLFVCTMGILRSATAANLYAKKGYNTRCVGSSEDALIPLSMNLIAWADHIFFVNPENYKQAEKKFHFSHELVNKSQVLNIPDQFEYNAPDLIRRLEEQVQLSI